MIRSFLIILTILLPFHIWAQESTVFDSLSLYSRILNKNKTFSIYLPGGYDSTGVNYPVLYLLHGGQGSHRDWMQKGDMQRITDKEIGDSRAVPMIVVMPDAEAYYMNNAAGKFQFEDFFIKELIPYIEKNYRCRSEKKFRAIAGLSMGGFGSLLYAIHHPGLFSSCAALSAAVRTDEEIMEMPYNEYLSRYGRAMGDLKEGDQRITAFWNQNSILYLVKKMPEEQKKAVRFYLDVGDDDFLYKGNSLLHMSMRDLKIPHEYRVRNGDHNWEYWKTGLPGVLNFVSESFK